MREQAGREVKIAEGVSVLERVAKLLGGLVRVSAVNTKGKLRDIHLSVDFFFFPAARLVDLERALEGSELRVDPLAERIDWFFRTYQISAPGIPPEALAKVICAEQG